MSGCPEHDQGRVWDQPGTHESFVHKEWMTSTHPGKPVKCDLFSELLMNREELTTCEKNWDPGVQYQ